MGALDEGYCLKITATVSVNTEVWLLCFNDERTQQSWFQKLKDVALI